MRTFQVFFAVVFVAGALVGTASGQGRGTTTAAAPATTTKDQLELLTAREAKLVARIIQGVDYDLSSVSPCNLGKLDEIFSAVNRDREAVRVEWQAYYADRLALAKSNLGRIKDDMQTLPKILDARQKALAEVEMQLEDTKRRLASIPDDPALAQSLKALKDLEKTQTDELNESRDLLVTVGQEMRTSKDIIAAQDIVIAILGSLSRRKGIADEKYQSLLRAKRSAKYAGCQLTH